MIRACHSLLVLVLLIAVATPASSQWVAQSFPFSDTFAKVRFADTSNGWILGQKFVYRTTDAGATWTKGDTSDSYGTLLGLHDRDTLFTAGYGTSAPWTNGLRRSIDGGRHFTVVDTQKVLWNDIVFVGGGTGLVVGGLSPSLTPIIKRTTDDGVTWTTVWTGTGGSPVQGIAFPEPLHGWACVYDGTLLETTDGGNTWSVQDSIKVQPFSPLRAAAFANKDVGIMAGGVSGNALVARTTNGGRHWTSQVFFGCSFREACFLGGATAWIGGASNGSPFIAMSSDNGATWVKRDGGLSPSGVESFAMVSAIMGWAVSARVVYKTTNGGITAVEGLAPEAVPTRFHLDQNYPNPFNPSTSIRYGLPIRSWVKLTVTNTLGQQVAELYNGEQEAGYHEVRFDGHRLPSGAYFYRLQSQNWTESKRFLLVR